MRAHVADHLPEVVPEGVDCFRQVVLVDDLHGLVANAGENGAVLPDVTAGSRGSAGGNVS